MREMRPIEFPCLVAFSGGADSRLLLELAVRAALECAGDGAVGELVKAAHLHHGIRGPEADRDEAFCRAVCADLGIPLIVEHADVPAMAAASGDGVEAAARRARYDFFVRTMQTEGIPILLTAHHADDQLETVLLHLLRGSGTHGMGGIPPIRTLGETATDGRPLQVVRPLLDWSKQDILNALRELGLDAVTDSTNLADDCTRNRLRHHVIPLLEEIAGTAVPQNAAARLSQAAREDDEALTAIARARCAAAVTPIGLPAAAVAAETPAVAKRMIRLAYAAVAGCSQAPPCPTEHALPADRTLSAYHTEKLLTLCREGQDGAVSDLLPADMRGELLNGYLVFRAVRTDTPPPPSPRPLTAGITPWDDAVMICIECGDAPLEPLAGGAVFASAVFPADRVPLPLYARARAPGDVILSHGMTKRLKKLICDKHIPTHLRNRLPLLCLGDGTPLWYPGVAFRDGFPPPDSGPALRVTVSVSHDRQDPIS